MPFIPRRFCYAVPLALAALAACRDGAGPDGTGTRADRTAPTAQINFPTGAGRSSATLHLTGTVGDDNSVTRATFQLDGGLERALAVSPGESPRKSAVHLNTSVTLPAGRHTLVVHAYDAAGNRGSSAPLQIEVDASAPQVQLEIPAALTVAADTLRVRGVVTDDYNLGYVDVGRWPGLGARFTAANQGRVPRYAVDTLVSLAVGANEIRVTAFDSVGNETRVTVLATRIPARSLARFDAVFAQGQQGCGLRSGAAYCWGEGGTGALGNGRMISRDTPVPVAGGLAFSALSVGGSGSTCGVATDGAAYCWGADFYGGLGRGATTAGFAATPQRVASDVRFTAISTRMSSVANVCALAVSGEAYCWGANSFGQAGVPSSTASCQLNGNTVACVPAPARVQGGLRFTSISVSESSACAVAVDGRAYCWGGNGMYGKLGNGETNTSYSTPTPVAGGHLFSMVSAGDGWACGVTTAGAAYCWGENPNGGTQGNPLPTLVESSVRFRSVGLLGRVNAGACALGEDGEVYCWGGGRSLPTRVEGGLKFTRLSPSHGCGVTADRAAYCWTPTTAPVPVPGEY